MQTNIDSYIVISRNEDEPYIQVMNKTQLAGYLRDDGQDLEMLATAPINLMEFPDKSILIIKGTVVVPRAKTQITSWEIP